METLQEVRVRVLSKNDIGFFFNSLEEFKNSIYGLEKTKETYINSVSKFFKWIESNQVQYVDIQTLERFRAEMIEKYSATSVNVLITGIKAYYNFLESHYQVTNIARSLKGVRKSTQPKKDSLSIQEVHDLLSELESDTSSKGVRDKAIITLMIYTGLRTCEVVRADIQDIRTVNGKKVLYVMGKGHTEKDDFVELTRDVQHALNDYLRTREAPGSHDPLFVSECNRTKGQRLSTRGLRNIVKDRFSEVGINSENISTHSLRHTSVTLALIGGASIQKAQAMARHSNISTTQIYAHNLERLDENNAENSIQRLLRKERTYAY